MDLNKEELALKDKIAKAEGEELVEILKLIRTEGKLALFPSIIDLLNTQKNESIRNMIAALLNDIKDKLAIDILADELLSQKNEETKRIITCACWMNGLDFSPRMDVFIKTFIEESYLVAIEALSVIENSVSNCEDDKIDAFIVDIKNAILKEEKDKKPILMELLSSLKDIKNAG